MPNWEYKVISSGSLGFASLALLEQHLNQLGKEEWEVIHFQAKPDNPLAFQGLARRPVMRDWVVEAAPPAGMPAMKSGAVPAPPEERAADVPSVSELRAEAEGRRESLLAREESLRPVRGAAGDESAADDDEEEEPDEFEDEAGDDLPTFFEAIRPHMRRNQRGPGMAVGVEYLAKKFEQTESDLIEALKECGFTIPAGAKDQPAYLEYDGDLYWLNRNHRGQLWINIREKPRASFKPVAGRPVAPEAAAPAAADAADRTPEPETPALPATQNAEPRARSPEPPAPPAELPAGPALLDRLRPLMRRNRRGSGLSGSMSYLARALRTDPAALEAAFGSLGLVLPAAPADPPVSAEIGEFVYWLNRDKTGQTWINARVQRAGAEEAPPAPVPPGELPLEPVAAPGPESGTLNPEPKTQNPEPSAPASPLAAVRLLLKETRRGGVAAEVGHLAGQLGKTVEELLAALVGAGLQVPEKARAKPVFAEHAGEIFWLNRNARDELWLNAKASKFAQESADGGDAGAAEDKSSPDESAAARKPHRSRRK